MLKKLNIIILALISITIISCSDSTETKTIQKQRIGDYLVLISSGTGEIESGSGKFYVEFRNAKNNVYIDVGNVNATAEMNMSGMPMSSEISVNSTDQLGRYEIKYNFSMSGTWIFDVNFADNERVRFSLAVN